jgi:hypothetical protein
MLPMRIAVRIAPACSEEPDLSKVRTGIALVEGPPSHTRRGQKTACVTTPTALLVLLRLLQRVVVGDAGEAATTATRPAFDHESPWEVMLKQRDSGNAVAPSEPPLL